MRSFYADYLYFGDMVYLALVTNFLLAVVNLPLLFLFVATDVRVTWPPILALIPLLTISVTAAFSVFARFTTGGTAEVVRDFGRGLVSHARGAGATGVAIAIGTLVLVVDIRTVSDLPAGAAAIPLFVMFLALLWCTSLHVLVAMSLGVGQTSRLALWKACLYLAVRRWYLTGLSGLALGLLASFVYAMPAWGVGLAASPILYLAWANCRHSLLPIAGVSEEGRVQP